MLEEKRLIRDVDFLVQLKGEMYEEHLTLATITIFS